MRIIIHSLITVAILVKAMGYNVGFLIKFCLSFTVCWGLLVYLDYFNYENLTLYSGKKNKGTTLISTNINMVGQPAEFLFTPKQ